MSLFGGDTDRSASAHESEVSDAPLEAPSSLPYEPANEDAQYDPTLYSNVFADDVDDEFEDLDYENEADSDFEDDNLVEDERPQRSNRFTGNPSTWRKFTGDARQIAASLDRMQAADLSSHLYNAHALKLWARQPTEQLQNVKDWQQKETWMKKGKSLEFEDIVGERQMELIPRKRWTAWPLHPSNNTTAGYKKVRRGSADVRASAGDELREEMLAVFLRIAKENWTGRYQSEKSRNPDVGFRTQIATRPKSVRSERSPSRATTDVDQTDSDIEMQDRYQQKTDEDLGGDEEKKLAQVIGRKRGRPPPQPSVRAAFLADDDKARLVLQYSINSTLSKLDDLAVAVRRTRYNHFGRGAYANTSGSEFTSEAESVGPDSTPSTPGRQTRSRSKSRIARNGHANSAGLSERKSAEQVQKGAGARHQLQDNVEGHVESGVDQKFDPDLNEKSDAGLSTKRRRSSSVSFRDRRSSTESFMANEASVQVGLMDWSEILGIAAMTGWEPTAISRTAQRCADLFGEGMSFRKFDENVKEKSEPEVVRYIPAPIHASDVLGLQQSPPTKRPYFEPGTLRCPHTDCRGHEKDHEIPYRVIEHVMRTHGYDPRENDSDNEDRKLGGVHKDGFLQPVTAKNGWLGFGRTKPGASKRTKKQAEHEKQS